MKHVWPAVRTVFAGPSPYWLTRFVFLRALGFVYLFAFLSLANELLPLVGSDGLLPAGLFLERVAAAHGGRLEAFLALPTLFWLDVSDGILLATCWTGVALSLAVLLGYANGILLLLLWLLDLSLVHVCQIWSGFFWETLLLETGLLAVFLCPLLDGRPFPRTPPPLAVVWLLRWMLFRLMLGAGLIKIRGDSCWSDLSCLIHHFETQPNPHPASWWFHNLPASVHRLGVLFNHFVELVVPWFALAPRTLRTIAGGLLLLFQLVLISSGNLAFVNWLTLAAVLVCFDDRLLRRVLPARLVAAADRASAAARPSRVQGFAVAGFCLLVAILSVAPVKNLLSSSQVMNASFEPLHIVNTYGAFGSVGKWRNEVVLQGTRDEPGPRATWTDYEWKCKPGDPLRRPCLITPYHYRFDWMIWFAAMSDYRRHPWVAHLGWKLLHNDPGALSLLAENPFPDEPPRYIRAELYRYEFTSPAEETDAWWRRRRIASYLPPLSIDNEKLRRFLRAHGW